MSIEACKAGGFQEMTGLDTEERRGHVLSALDKASEVAFDQSLNERIKEVLANLFKEADFRSVNGKDHSYFPSVVNVRLAHPLRGTKMIIGQLDISDDISFAFKKGVFSHKPNKPCHTIHFPEGGIEGSYGIGIFKASVQIQRLEFDDQEFNTIFTRKGSQQELYPKSNLDYPSWKRWFNSISCHPLA